MSLRSIGRKCRQKRCSEVSIRSVAQKCRSEVSIRSVEQKCCSEVLLRRVPQKCCQKCTELELLIRSEVWIRRVAQKCQSEVWFRSIAQKCRAKVSVKSVAQMCRSEVSNRTVAWKFRPEVCSRSVAQGCRSLLRGVAQKCRSGASRIVAQAAVLLIMCASDVSLKGVFRASLRSAAVLPRSVVQKRRSEVSLKSNAYMCVCVCSEGFLGSADQKHRSEVLLRSVDQKKCGS